MIILGNPSFATGMKLAGVKQSYVVQDKETAAKIFPEIPKQELVVANTSVVDLFSPLEELENLVTIPDDPEAFNSVDDLKNIVKTAIGFDIKLE
ncbi:hypothetical protein K8R43_05960 [archaeon]|nr:hypothetical protein [archaeon]